MRRTLRVLALALASVLAAPSLAAGPVDAAALWQEAASANAAGELDRAAAAYRTLLDAGYIDVNVYYNLGNVYHQLGLMPHAILAWRRGAELAPRDPDLMANLDFVRRSTVDGVYAPDPEPWFAPWQSALSVAEGVWLGAGLTGLGLVLLGLRRRGPETSAVGLGLLALLVGGLVFMGAWVRQGLPPVAVMLVDELKVTSDLGGGVELFVLHAGAEVSVVEAAAGRLLIALPDGRRGWALESAMGRVDARSAMPELPAR